MEMDTHMKSSMHKDYELTHQHRFFGLAYMTITISIMTRDLNITRWATRTFARLDII